MKAPAFQFYPKDWDADVNVIPMSYEEEGVYWALCRRYWLDGGTLPADLNRLRLLLKGRPSLKKMQAWWEVLSPCFQKRGTQLTHKRLDAERKKQGKNRKIRRLAAEKRWKDEHARRDAHALQNRSLSSSSSTTTPVSKKKTGREKPAPDPRVRSLGVFFNQLHVEKFDTKASFSPGKDSALLKGLLAERSEPEIQALMRAFFASEDKFINGAGFTIGVFKSQVGKLIPLIAKAKPKPVEEPYVSPRETFNRQYGMAGPEGWRDECAVQHEGRCNDAFAHWQKSRRGAA